LDLAGEVAEVAEEEGRQHHRPVPVEELRNRIERFADRGVHVENCDGMPELPCPGRNP